MTEHYQTPKALFSLDLGKALEWQVQVGEMYSMLMRHRPHQSTFWVAHMGHTYMQSADPGLW